MSQSQLRITAWPGVPLPLPPVTSLECALDASGEVIVPRVDAFIKLTAFEGADDWVADTHETVVTPTGETYLRLAELDLEDPDAILDFVRDYGPLGGGLARASLLGDKGAFAKPGHGDDP